MGKATPVVGDRDPAPRGAPAPAHAGAEPRTSVIVCAFSDARWDALCAAVASIDAQSHPAHQAIVVIDHNPGLLARARARFTGATVIENSGRPGLSGARNSGIKAATGEVVAFLDDDAVADPGWLEALARGFADPRVLGAGGAVDPLWAAGRPAWFPAEFDWVVGCAHNGMPTGRTAVRNVIGANMAFRAEALRALDGFREGIGRVGAVPLGCEETDLCIRARQRWPSAEVLYDPAARVEHLVPPDRGSLRYFLSRCRAEGRSKALLARFVGAADGLSDERAYTARTLPRGVLRGLRDALHGDLAGLRRAGAIVLGLATTTLGYASGRLAREGHG